MEQWVDIQGYENLYQISNLGKIKSLPIRRQRVAILKNKYATRPRPERVLKQPLACGYPSVTLCKGGKRSQCYVHRLLAIHFIPNPENRPHINHKDGTRTNNALDNLEWVTHKENIQHYWKPEPMSPEIAKVLKELGPLKKSINFAI